MAAERSFWSSIVGGGGGSGSDASSSPVKILQASIAGLIGLLIALKLVLRLRVRLPPGPFAWPVVGNWLQFREGLNPMNLAKLAEVYGGVCMLQMGQRKVVVVSSPEAAKEVLVSKGAEFGSRARNLVFDMTTGQGQDLVFADYGEHWRKMRRIATVPFFTHKVVQQHRSVWEKEIESTIAELRSGSIPGSTTSGIILRDHIQLLMYNVVYRMMFGRTFSGLSDPLYVSLMSLNLENNRLAQSFKYSYGDFVPSLKPLLRGYLRDVWDANQRRLAFLRDAFLHERLKLAKSGKEEKIGVDHFYEAQTKGEISENNVLYLIQNMNVAAIETTLWSTEWGIAEMVNKPEIQKKLRDELDAKLGKGVPITEPDVANLPYLQALTKEILRAHMVIPMLVPHRNLKAEKLLGYDIPAGSRILVNAWGLANNPKYWERPEAFNPDRFLGSKLEATGNDMTFIPFGVGRRSCPGSLLALPILGLILGRLVQEFELLPPPGVDQLDLRAVGGQLSLSMAVKSRVVLRPIPRDS